MKLTLKLEKLEKRLKEEDKLKKELEHKNN